MDVHHIRDVLDVKNASVANSRFDDVNLFNSHFHNANLSAVSFDQLLLSNSRVVDANLSNTHFSNVNMSGVTIDNAILTGMTIDGVKVSDLFVAYQSAKVVG